MFEKFSDYIRGKDYGYVGEWDCWSFSGGLDGSLKVTYGDRFDGWLADDKEIRCHAIIGDGAIREATRFHVTALS
jgi:hypothetical protein